MGSSHPNCSTSLGLTQPEKVEDRSVWGQVGERKWGVMCGVMLGEPEGGGTGI